MVVNITTGEVRKFRERLVREIFEIPATPIDLKRFLENKIKELDSLAIIEANRIGRKR